MRQKMVGKDQILLDDISEKSIKFTYIQ